MNKEINSIIHKALSDADLRNILGKETKILTYPELSKYDSIEQLLTKPYDFVIILLLESPMSGHWTALLRYNDVYEYFDSYGNPVDYDLSHWLTPEQRAKLNESKKYLSYLLQGKKNIYNKVKYQQMKEGVNTCGSHVSYRCFKFKNDNFDLKTYQKHMANTMKVYGLTADQVVVEYVYSKLNM